MCGFGGDGEERNADAPEFVLIYLDYSFPKKGRIVRAVKHMETNI